LYVSKIIQFSYPFLCFIVLCFIFIYLLDFSTWWARHVVSLHQYQMILNETRSIFYHQISHDLWFSEIFCAIQLIDEIQLFGALKEILWCPAQRKRLYIGSDIQVRILIWNIFTATAMMRQRSWTWLYWFLMGIPVLPIIALMENAYPMAADTAPNDSSISLSYPSLQLLWKNYLRTPLSSAQISV